ncbi:MAG: hypothetical protein JNM41_10225 [Flavipsychrobacter sp.]|nr:hypothetical protein [Flavipsychrobacter sp.]
MNTILIPTDFTVGSLEIMNTLARGTDNKLNFILFHAFDMPGSLVEAMSRAGINSHNKLITENLRLACKRIKANNNNIANISFRNMYGTTIAAFKNYAEANAIDMIALPPDFRFVHITRESVDPTRMFKKSGLPLLSSPYPIRETTDTNADVNMNPGLAV